MNDSSPDAEIDRGFEMTRALGTSIMTTSTQMTVARRIAPLADKHKIAVGLHGHSNITDPNGVCDPRKLRRRDEDVESTSRSTSTSATSCRQTMIRSRIFASITRTSPTCT